MGWGFHSVQQQGRDAVARIRSAPLQPPDKNHPLARFLWGFFLPFTLIRVGLRAPSAKDSFIRTGAATSAVTLIVALLLIISPTTRSWFEREKREDDEEIERTLPLAPPPPPAVAARGEDLPAQMKALRRDVRALLARQEGLDKREAKSALGELANVSQELTGLRELRKATEQLRTTARELRTDAGTGVEAIVAQSLDALASQMEKEKPRRKDRSRKVARSGESQGAAGSADEIADSRAAAPAGSEAADSRSAAPSREDAEDADEDSGDEESQDPGELLQDFEESAARLRASLDLPTPPAQPSPSLMPPLPSLPPAPPLAGEVPKAESDNASEAQANDSEPDEDIGTGAAPEKTRQRVPLSAEDARRQRSLADAAAQLAILRQQVRNVAIAVPPPPPTPWLRRAVELDWLTRTWKLILALYTALSVVEWGVLALSRDYQDQAMRKLSLATGTPPDDPEKQPRIRVDFKWMRRKLKRRFRGMYLFVIGMLPLGALIGPCGGKPVVSVVAAIWSGYWLGVFTLAKSRLAWDDSETRDPWYVKLYARSLGRIPGLGWYGRLMRRLSGSVRAPCQAFERAPYESAGLAVSRVLLGVPGIYSFVRPVFTVASQHVALARPDANRPEGTPALAFPPEPEANPVRDPRAD